MIKFNNLTVTYNDNTVISDFTYGFANGNTAITGSSGIGKTSLVNAILSLIPYEGTIESDEKYSVVFQEDRLCDNLTAMKNIQLVCSDKKRITEGFEAMGLSDCMNEKVMTLSGGMKRRVAILRGVLADYTTLIMDEPFKGLDNDTKLSVMNYVKKMTSGKSVLLVTHDLSEANFFNCNILNLSLGIYGRS